jgi:hypothetical protein
MRNVNHLRIGMLLGFVGSLLPGYQTAKADFVFGEPTRVPNINSSAADYGPCVTADGLELYFGSNRDAGGNACGDSIWVATRATIDEPWGTPRSLGPPFNTSSYGDTNPSISADGLELYFSDLWPPLLGGCELRPGGYGRGDVLVSRRDTREAAWGPPVNLGPAVNSFDYDGSPHISADGLSLYFCTARSAGHGFDLYVSTRPTKDDPWTPAVDLGAPINTMASQDYLTYPSLTPDGLFMFFTAAPLAYTALGDVFMSVRASATDPWGPPIRLAALNSAKNEESVCFSVGDFTIYFGRSDPYNPNGSYESALATFDIWQSKVTPIVDFNGDGAVDNVDIGIMVDLWGTGESLCDIGPLPWGDGIVDIQDLIILVEHMVETTANDVDGVNDPQ